MRSTKFLTATSPVRSPLFQNAVLPQSLSKQKVELIQQSIKLSTMNNVSLPHQWMQIQQSKRCFPGVAALSGVLMMADRGITLE